MGGVRLISDDATLFRHSPVCGSLQDLSRVGAGLCLPFRRSGRGAWGHAYLDVAAGRCWAVAAHLHETSRSSGVGSH